VIRQVVDAAVLLSLLIAAVVWLMSPPKQLVAGMGIEIMVLFVAAFFLSWRYEYRSSWLMFRAALLGFAACLIIFSWNRLTGLEHRIGERKDYGDDFDCGRVNETFPNPSGKVAVLREVECVGPIIFPPSRDYYVFIHSRTDRENDVDDLALSYRVTYDDYNSENAWRTEPMLKWLSGASLQIGMGAASSIWTKVNTLGDVRVSYAAGGTRVSDAYRWLHCAGRSCDSWTSIDVFPR
jgi:energy-coupling factor transporter transmembrane protein EcfT